jgi:hypothetical protein
MQPYLVARACTLAPGSTDDPELPGDVAKSELRVEFAWALTETGALYLRAGRPVQAVWPLERSLVVNGRPGTTVLNWLWLALAYQKMGKPDEARRWLVKADEWLDQQGGRMPLLTQVIGLSLHNWLEAHVLLEEAKRLLR